MSNIFVNVNDQQLQATNTPVIASRGVKEDYVIFSFSEEWNGFGKTAIFYNRCTPEQIFQSAVDVDGKALVPHEVTEQDGTMYFGVCGVKDDVILTSELLSYNIVKGVYTGGGESQPPTPGIFEQMVTIAGQMQNNYDLLKNQLQTEITNRQMAIAQEAMVRANADQVLSSRMDTFASLPEGSTSGNAELLDIRVGTNGTTYPSAGAAVRGQIDDLNNCYNTEIHVSENLLNPDEIEIGCYYWINGKNESASYNSTPLIPVEEGQTIYLQVGTESKYGRLNRGFTFVVTYDANKNIITELCQRSVESYTVSSGVSYIRLSVVENMLNANMYPSLLVSSTGEIQDYIPYFEPYTVRILKAECNNDEHINTLIDAKVTDERLIFEKSVDLLESGNNLTIAERIDNKKNCSYLMYAKFSTFDSISLNHGFTEYMSSYITVDDTNIYQYYHNGSQAILQNTYPHGLTISDFLFINIEVPNVNNFRAKVTIMTNGGEFTQANVPFPGCNGDVVVKATMNLTDVKCQYICNDGKYDVFVFGDSYISIGDDSKWTYQIMEKGYSKMLLCGFGGATSLNEIVPFRNIIAVKKPKIVVWTLGMNDGDTTSAYNANWKTCIDELIATCEENGITPILATIPNVPNINHTFKNAWIRNSGHRYVDFAKAVGAEELGSSWYSGMLGNDNTHPSQLGAKALANRFLLDVPEVVYEN